jgi:hypothetical protein
VLHGTHTWKCTVKLPLQILYINKKIFDKSHQNADHSGAYMLAHLFA